MVHVTLNSGYAVTLPSGMVHEQTRELLAPIIAARQGKLPGFGAAYRVVITVKPGVCAYTFYRGEEPLSLNLVCGERAAEDHAWKEIEAVYLSQSDKAPGLVAASANPERPSVPWIATVLLPAIGLIGEDAGFIGHMEACFGILLLRDSGA